MIQDTDLCIFDWYRLTGCDIRYYWCIQVDNLAGFLWSLVNRSKREHHWRLYTLNWVRMERVRMDFATLLARVLKVHLWIMIALKDFVDQWNIHGTSLTSWNAVDKWIACQIRWTTAYRIMIDNVAGGSESTWTGTWIHTFLIGTSLCQGTIGADYTFWSTSWWCPQESCYAGTDWLSVDHSTDTVWSTGWRWTRISSHGICCDDNIIIIQRDYKNFFMLVLIIEMEMLWPPIF